MLDETELKLGDVIILSQKNGKILNDYMYFYPGGGDLLEVRHSPPRTKRIKISHAKIPDRFSIYRYQNGNDEWLKRLNVFLKFHNFDRRVINLYLVQLKESNGDSTEFLEELPMLIPPPEISDGSTYEEMWLNILSKMKPGDLFFTSDPTSVLSRIICKVTSGPWSHTGIVGYNQMVFEMLTSGIVHHSIMSYKDGKSRIGIYRLHPELSIEQVEQALAYASKESFIPQKYGYGIAFAIGVCNLFGVDHPTLYSPMDLVFSGVVRLICFI